MSTVVNQTFHCGLTIIIWKSISTPSILRTETLLTTAVDYFHVLFCCLPRVKPNFKLSINQKRGCFSRFASLHVANSGVRSPSRRFREGVIILITMVFRRWIYQQPLALTMRLERYTCLVNLT